jgi:hypothetical protein
MRGAFAVDRTLCRCWPSPLVCHASLCALIKINVACYRECRYKINCWFCLSSSSPSLTRNQPKCKFLSVLMLHELRMLRL